MTQVSYDWNFLGKNTLVPGVTVLASVFILTASYWFQAEQKKIFEIYSANQAVIHQDYDALVYRRRLLDRYHRRYQELQDSGFVGRENRLDWIETIRSTAKDLDLPNVTYSLEPQREVLVPVETAAANAQIQIYLSRLELELGLVHELDLLRFFARLELEAPGLMQVDRCDLTRHNTGAERLLAETNIVATCSMALFSVITSDISFAAVEHGL